MVGQVTKQKTHLTNQKPLFIIALGFAMNPTKNSLVDFCFFMSCRIYSYCAYFNILNKS